MYGDRTPRDKVPGPASQTRTNALRGIRDFVGFKTMRDPGLRGIWDFAGLRTSWDLGLRREQELYTPRTRILFCGVLYVTGRYKSPQVPSE